MLIRFRQVSFFYYRLFFITLLLLMGIGGIGIVLLEHFIGVTLLITETEVDHNALYATSGVMGTLGIISAMIMLYLMHDKRSYDTDRRQNSYTIAFSDRRSSIDRRLNTD